MKFATVRDLKNKTSEMLRLAASGKHVLVTSHGRPIAVLQGLSEEDLEDFVLSHHPKFQRLVEEAEREYRRKGGIPLKEVRARLMKKLERKNGQVRD